MAQASTVGTESILNQPSKSAWASYRFSPLDLMFALALLSLVPMVWLQSASLWSRPHMQFFPLAWLMFAYFVYERAGRIETCHSRVRFFIAIAVLLVSLAGATAAVMISSPWLSYACGVGVVFAWLLARAGQMRWYSVVALMSLLGITINIPAGFDTKLIQFLQMQSSAGASAVLDALGIAHMLEGNTLLIKAKRLFVDEACSGVDSFYALVAISLTILLWTRQKLAVAICALAMVPVWASCSNLIRLTAIVCGLEWLGVDLSEGTPHTILGTITFVIAFMCDYSFIRVMSEMFADAKQPSEFSESPSGQSKLIDKADRAEVKSVPPRMQAAGWALSIVIAFCYLAVGGVSAKVLFAKTMFWYPDFSKPSLARLDEGLKLPEDFAGWKFAKKELAERSIDNVMGRFSHTWMYDTSKGYGLVSADFPFRGFHLLDICYEGAGWRAFRKHEVMNVEINDPRFAKYGPLQVHFLDLNKGIDEHCYVAYAMFNLDGSPVVSKSGARGFERFEQTIMEPISYQIQVVVGSSAPLTDEERTAALERLKVAATSFRPVFQTLDIVNPK